MIQKMNEKESQKITHSLAKKGRPFEDYTWTVDLRETDHNIVYRTVKCLGTLMTVTIMLIWTELMLVQHLIEILKVTLMDFIFSVT